MRRSWVTLTLKQGLIGTTQCPFPSLGRRIEEERRQRRRRKEGMKGEGKERKETRKEKMGFVLVGASHKHYHLESRVSPCHGRHQKGGRRSCRGSGGGGGEPRRQVTQEVDRTVCPAGVRCHRQRRRSASHRGHDATVSGDKEKTTRSLRRCGWSRSEMKGRR